MRFSPGKELKEFLGSNRTDKLRQGKPVWIAAEGYIVSNRMSPKRKMDLIV